MYGNVGFDLIFRVDHWPFLNSKRGAARHRPGITVGVCACCCFFLARGAFFPLVYTSHVHGYRNIEVWEAVVGAPSLLRCCGGRQVLCGWILPDLQYAVAVE